MRFRKGKNHDGTRVDFHGLKMKSKETRKMDIVIKPHFHTRMIERGGTKQVIKRFSSEYIDVCLSHTQGGHYIIIPDFGYAPCAFESYRDGKKWVTRLILITLLDDKTVKHHYGTQTVFINRIFCEVDSPYFLPM